MEHDSVRIAQARAQSKAAAKSGFMGSQFLDSSGNKAPEFRLLGDSRSTRIVA
jgi:hypothetical protein